MTAPDALAPVPPSLPQDPALLEAKLLGAFRGMESAVVAYSGGVDSTLVAVAATRALGKRCLTVIGDSASLARSDLAEARGLAERFGLNLREVKPLELENPAYRANPVDRCYHCKSELFGLMEKLCQDEGWRTILDGYNRDDDGDYRPGRKAAGERAVKSPLSEAGFGKKEVRLLARAWGLPNWDKPAAPCLSSRFPYGTAIDAEKLSRVERAEAFLRGLGLREFRVRFHEAMARIEARPEDFPRLLEARAELTVAFRGFGFKDTVLDLTGFRSGSLNEGLPGPLGGPAKS